MDPLLEEFRKQSGQILEMVQHDLRGIKTGRAKPALVEDVKIPAYNTTMLLKELASISVPNLQQITVSPWDKSLLEPIEKGLASAGLNINPIIDGEIVRIKIPPLTQETRAELVKLVNQKIESARAMLRQIRGESKSKIDEKKGKAGVSEDDVHRDLEEMQSITDEVMKKLDELAESKETELMSL